MRQARRAIVKPDPRLVAVLCSIGDYRTWSLECHHPYGKKVIKEVLGPYCRESKAATEKMNTNTIVLTVHDPLEAAQNIAIALRWRSCIAEVTPADTALSPSGIQVVCSALVEATIGFRQRKSRKSVPRMGPPVSNVKLSAEPEV